jgi:hypothetical protein
MRSEVIRRFVAAAVAASCAAGVAIAQQPAGPKFRADDPINVDDDRAVDAGRVARDTLGSWSDFIINTFFPVVVRDNRRAENVNTIDEVPDSSWFTNRLGSRPMSLEEIVRGPDRVERLEVQQWVIVEGKDTGRQPGFRAIDPSDPSGQIYQIEFDPPGNPELATGAEIIGTAVYHALGYNVVDVYLVELDRAKLQIAPNATVSVNGRTRAFTTHDLDRLLRSVARKPNGRYRALASRFAEGRNVGPFRYYGTRPDDPNDIYPHEHRRELRGNRVFAAWLNHDDSRSINTLDMLEGSPGRQAIRHYMFDFGSIMGSGTDGNDHPWVGHEQVVEGGPAWRTLLSLGAYRRPYLKVKAPSGMPAAGHFTADRFDPAAWRPHYPNPAFENMRADDAFWAAHKLAALTPEAIGAIVRKAKYSDPRVADYIAGTLTLRRAKALRTWLTGVNPVRELRVTGNRLAFVNAAIDAGVATPNARYELSWFGLDNDSGQHYFLRDVASVTAPIATVPPVLESSEYMGVEIRTFHSDFPHWAAPVRVYFRKSTDGWTTVGIERVARDNTLRVAAR